MRRFHIFKGIRGALTLYNQAVRFAYMITDQAKLRAQVLTFWRKHGLKATMDAYQVSRRTLYRWQLALEKGKGQLEALNPKSTAPHQRRERIVSHDVTKRIISLREDKYRLGKVQIQGILKDEGYTIGSVSSVGRILIDLKKKGRLPYLKRVSLYGRTGTLHERKPRTKRRKLRRKQHERVLQIDTIVQYIDGVKRYILTAIDTTTRVAFAACYTNHGSKSAADFLYRCQQVIPDSPKAIQTDNGSEFAKYFQQTATILRLTHYYTYPRCPKMNANVERFNRTLQEEWLWRRKALLRDNVPVANNELVEYLLWYNSKRRHHALNLRSPFQAMVESLSLSKSECHMWWTYTHCTGGS